MHGNIIEGDFLEVHNGDIFEVRGLVHPSDGYTAYARYVRSTYGDRVSVDGRTYRKLSTLQEKMSYAQRRTPSYLHFDPRKDRVVQVVPKKDIVHILSPAERLREISECSTVSDLEKDVIDFSAKLSTKTGISFDNMGVIGSPLAGLAHSSSDIDLIIYGYKTGRRFYTKMREILSNEDDELERYSGKGLAEHTQSRWGERSSMPDLERIEGTKVLQGRFRSRDFFIRLVPNKSEVGHTYEDYITKSSGLVYRTCNIVDDYKAIFTPCEYSVACEEDPFLTKIVGYQSRFAECASEGMRVKVFGKLESVISQFSGFHKQIVLGGYSLNSFLPIREMD
ncbi:hypothetical protein EU537_01295 [Candidatus Thorarchaeota archaeon]|nr:MAG: hypothetical protein EU537_01295 [Candidatus Thorarchaeota archaeon]